MAKALTKEDLVYILQALFKLSQNADNALHRAEDNGLYVKDLSSHVEDTSVHVTQNILDILNRISVSEDDELLFDEKPLATHISSEADNSIVKKDDGLYVPTLKLSQKADNSLAFEPDGLYNKDVDASSHIDDEHIHVTQDDKDNWNGVFKASTDYTDQNIENLPIHNFYFTTQLPTENQDEKTLYFLANDPDRPLECTYTIYLYQNGEYHTLGVTNKTLNKYLTIEQFTQEANNFVHANQSILDAITEDEFGTLCYKGQNIFSNAALSSAENNAIVVKDGKLYVKDYTQEINSIVRDASLIKTNLYDGEINESGKYKLKDSIDNYNLILVEYYYKPDNPDRGTPGCIQTACIDPDTLNDAYSMGMLYILQYGYGMMTSNSQIHIVEDELFVDYYHNVCIYKITGVGKRVDENAESTE